MLRPSADELPEFDGDLSIAIVSHSHPSLSKGGAEIAAYTLFSGLLSIGVDAIFVAACPESQRARLELGSAREQPLFFDPVNYEHFYHLASPKTAGELSSLLLRERIGLANFHHYLNLGINTMANAAMSAGLKMVVTFHEYLAICANHGQMVTRPGHFLCSSAEAMRCASCFPDYTPEKFRRRRDVMLSRLSKASAFVSPSHFLVDRYSAWGLPRERFTVIENGLPNAAHLSADVDEPSGAVWTFGYFGQITPFKGVDMLLDAAPLIAADEVLSSRIKIKIHGNMVGQSEAFRARFEDVLSKYSFVSYFGPYANSQVFELMKACSYVVVPSRWWENSPVVIQEAYAAKRPVLCSGLGGLAEKVIDGVSGLHFRMGDPADFVQVVKSAADLEKFRTLLAGLPVPPSATDMARSYLDVYRRCYGDAVQGAEDLLGG